MNLGCVLPLNERDSGAKEPAGDVSIRKRICVMTDKPLWEIEAMLVSPDLVGQNRISCRGVSSKPKSQGCETREDRDELLPARLSRPDVLRGT